jgi:hypothetical protein
MMPSFINKLNRKRTWPLLALERHFPGKGRETILMQASNDI